MDELCIGVLQVWVRAIQLVLAGRTIIEGQVTGNDLDVAMKTLTEPGLEPETSGLPYQRSTIRAVQPFGWWWSQIVN